MEREVMVNALKKDNTVTGNNDKGAMPLDR